MTAQLISPSALYCAAAKLKPLGDEPVPADTYCIMCAAALPKGTLAARPTGKKPHETAKKIVGDSFNNKLHLRAMTGTHVCGHCVALWSNDWLGKYSKSFACSEGVFFLQSNDDVAAFLLKPPEPPFVAVFSTKKKQHMVWRTPVSYSKDLFFVRIDDDVLTIRRAALLAGWEALRRAEAVMSEVRPDGKARYLKPPAALFARELNSAKVGMLRQDVESLLRQTENDALIRTINSLSIGEWWGLNFLRFVNLEKPPAWRDALVAAGSAEPEGALEE